MESNRLNTPWCWRRSSHRRAFDADKERWAVGIAQVLAEAVVIALSFHHLAAEPLLAANALHRSIHTRCLRARARQIGAPFRPMKLWMVCEHHAATAGGSSRNCSRIGGLHGVCPSDCRRTP